MKKTLVVLSSLAVSLTMTTPSVAYGRTNASSTPETSAAKIACVGSAVNTREAAIGTAMTTFTASTNSAYSARATALKQAYTQTTAKGVRGAVKTAWSTFKSSMKSARSTWKNARTKAWTDSKKAVAGCKAPSEVTDDSNMSLEETGV